MTTLVPGRDLDRLVAEKIFGCKVESKWIESIQVLWLFCTCEGRPHDNSDGKMGALKHYSTEIEDAWIVAEALRISLFQVPNGKNFHAAIIDELDDLGAFAGGLRINFSEGVSTAETAAFAICLQALRTKGVICQ